MRIGITLGLQTEYESMWVNGIKLNAILLANTLKQIPDVEVYIIDTSGKVEDLTKVAWDYNQFPVKNYYQFHKEIDLLFTLGTSLPLSMIEDFKKYGNKRVIKYQCGNSYVVDMERSIFKDDPNVLAPWDLGADEVWYVPQQGYQNHDYYRIAYRNEKVIPVPFVWDPMFLNQSVALHKKAGRKLPFYIPGKKNSEKKLNVFEPNLNVVKYAMVPIMIAEKCLRDGVEFENLFVASGNRLLKNTYFKSMIKHLDIVSGTAGPKIKFTNRYPIVHYLSESADIILSHQWENPLNYAYLDVAYFGFPIVHNADMVQDLGYYYSDFNIYEGADQLKYAIEEHDDNLEAYKERNQKVLNRYTIENKTMIDLYAKLIENAFGANHDFGNYEYDWKTNLYK
jgi:hypothetical protein